MTSAYADAETDKTEGHGSPCAGCDPDRLDDLKCKAQGIQAQANYNKAHEDALTQAQSQYDGARSAYNTAWSAARPTVRDLRKQLEQVIDQLKCLVNDPGKIRLLDKAFWIVERKLRDCYPNAGCTFDDDCDFDDKVSKCEAHDIAGVIADIERRVVLAVAAFDELIKEPASLDKRVKDLAAEVAEIVNRMPKDGELFENLYAAALVAQDHLNTVWNGFSDVNDYMDCLCRALTCQVNGYAAVSELKRKEAKHQCHLDRKKKACEHLRDHTGDEVIAEFIRLGGKVGKDDQHPHRDDGARYGEGDRGASRADDESGDCDRDRGDLREQGRDRNSDRYADDERGRS